MMQRQSNTQWSGGIVAQPVPKNSNFKNSVGKFLPRFLGIKTASSSLNIFQRGQTINAVQLKDILKEKRHGKVNKGVLFWHENSPAHWALATQKKLAYLGFQCLDHPLYSSDLAPSDYRPFPGLKKRLKICHFSSDAEVIAAAEILLDGQPSDFFF